MTEATKKETKPKTAKVQAQPKVAKEASPAKAAKAVKQPKAAPSGKTVKVTQLVGTIARKSDQRATLIGLGLNKRHRTRVLEDTPSVRGMIYKVRHLVKLEE